MKLSIIIPVYNVEKYVEKCLRSCAEQDISFDEYEIIIINDGAKDNSLEIIERVAKDYNNITILSQENAGLSSARNKGLSIAKGEYVWFVDSDDWIDKNCLQNILSEVDGNDVLVMGYIEAYDDISKNNIVDYKDKNINFGKCLLLSWFFFPAQLYVFKRSFLLNNSLSFYLGIFHEDSEFTPKMLYYADKIKILTKPIYYFYKRPNSITTSVNPKKSFDYIVVASSLSIFSQDVEIKYENKFNDIISLIINSSLHNSYNMNRIAFKELNHYIYEHKYLFKHLIGSSILKYKFEGMLFCIFPKYTIFIYRLLRKFNFK